MALTQSIIQTLTLLPLQMADFQMLMWLVELVQFLYFDFGRLVTLQWIVKANLATNAVCVLLECFSKNLFGVFLKQLLEMIS